MEHNRSERFGDGEGKGPDDASRDHVDPVEPTPTSVLADEAADEWTEDGAGVRSGSEDGDRKA